MPYKINDEGDGLYVTLYGDVTFDEIRKANAEGWEHPGWERHRFQIWDHREVTNFQLDATQLFVIARMDNVAFRATGRMRTALIADQPELIELLEHYCSTVDPEVTEARTFQDEAAARAWIRWVRGK